MTLSNKTLTKVKKEPRRMTPSTPEDEDDRKSFENKIDIERMKKARLSFKTTGGEPDATPAGAPTQIGYNQSMLGDILGT